MEVPCSATTSKRRFPANQIPALRFRALLNREATAVELVLALVRTFSRFTSPVKDKQALQRFAVELNRQQYEAR